MNHARLSRPAMPSRIGEREHTPVRSFAAAMRSIVGVVIASVTVTIAAAADVPRGTEVIDLDFVPGKFGPVHFKHAEHNEKFKRPDGSPVRCKDCHHRLKGDEPASPSEDMKCGGCHARMAEPEKVFDGKTARVMARPKPNGAIDYKSILFHRYCWACHRKTPRGERMNAGCRVCHERGVSSETVNTRYDSVQQARAGLSWLRCPAGGRWTGKACVGTPALVPWAGVASSCPSGWRIPTRAELLSLLDGCSPGLSDPAARCSSCKQSVACSQILGSGDGLTWTADKVGERAFVVDLAEGVARPAAKSEPALVRCVKDAS